MPRTTKTNETKKETNFKEFEFDGKEFKFTGRIYPDLKKSGDKVDTTPFSLCLNGVITIRNCKLVQGDKASWISWPQYKAINGSYSSYIYIDRAFNDAEIAALVENLETLI